MKKILYQKKTDYLCPNLTLKTAVSTFFLFVTLFTVQANSILKRTAKISLDSNTIKTKEFTNAPEHKSDFHSIYTISSQEYIIKGRIVDEDNVPLPGVSILVKDTSIGTSTDFDGNYTLKVTDHNAILIISYIGFKSKKVNINTRSTVNIVLQEDVNTLDDVTVVAFGTQKKESVIAAITTVKPEDLRIPSSNLTTAFAGKIPGIISYQRSGEPGANNAEFFIRGVTTFGYATSPLILIDGIESTKEDLSRIEVEDIGSFSVMKDATAAALYGSRGANGVILVNTKEGKEGKAKFSIKYESSISSNTRDIEYADPITYMNLFNEARVNEGAPLQFTQNHIDAVRNGTNKYAFPSTDWNQLLFRDFAVNQRANINISGGGKIARYYLSGTYSHDSGILKSDNSNNVNSGISLNKIQIRSNNNIQVTPTTEAKVSFYVALDDYKGPLNSASSLFDKIRRTSPVQFPAFYAPDEANKYANQILFGNGGGTDPNASNYINPYAEASKGFKQYTRSKMSLQINLEQKISEGFKARFKGGYDRYSYFAINRAFQPFYYNISSYDKYANTYTLNWLNEEDNPEDAIEFAPSGNPDVNTRLYLEFALNYNKTINEKHDIGATLVYNASERLKVPGASASLQSSLAARNIGYAGRFTYAYDNRYFSEINFGYNGSERFSKNHRFGFFPSIGVGWTISNETFWEPLVDIVNKFKITSTFGLVGNDNIGGSNNRFFYLSEIDLNNGSRNAQFGEEFPGEGGLNGVGITRYANENITWETAEKLDIGLQIGLFNNKFDLEMHYFSDLRRDIFLRRSEVPASLGLTTQVFANSGSAKSSGIEGRFTFNNQINEDFWIQATGNFTYATSKYLEYDEPDYSETPWRSRIGNSVRQQYGYVAERLFIDENDVANAPQQFGRTPNIQYGQGDLKYKDINGDDQINAADQVPIGNPTSPELNYGLGLSVGYKNWDFNVFLNGIGQTSFWINSEQTNPFSESENNGGRSINNLLKVYAADHWSTENRNSYALWPKLTTQPVQNNLVQSTWFLRDGAFLRLRSLEIGYTLPKNVTKKLNMSKARLYFSGNNLYTWSKFDLWDIEQGGNAFNYPNQKVLNLGIRLNF